MGNQNTFGWIVGVIIVLLIAVGIWWFLQKAPVATNTSTVATTTPAGGTDTTGTTPKPAATVTEVRTSSTVNGVISSLSGVSRFAALYASTGVSASVTGKGPYTVFVPADSAFANLSPGTLTNLTATQSKRLVQYHVVLSKMLDLDAVSSGNHVALSKDMLNFNVQAQTKIAYINSGYSIKQYKASNGMVYVISAVLVPPQTPNPTTGSTGTPIPR